MRRRPFAAASLVLCAAVPACIDSPPPDPPPSRASAISAPLEAFYVVLDGAPAVSAIGPGVDPRSPEAGVATRARVLEIEARHALVRPVLEEYGAEIVAEFSRLANAIQILADRDTAARIEQLAGVVSVEPVPLAQPTLASAVPVVGATAVWASPTLLQGDGITIGIIDSGIDYTHADFAGIGTEAAYLANDSTLIEPGSFPTTKVVGGWDFVGDDYNPDANKPAPKPDPDPLDCFQPENPEIAGGHGTHVAGIAAGAGVQQNGTTFAGPYEQSFDAASFRVAPGVAPRASLWALRIFGCAGSTTMLGAALERASDPNLDGMFDDRLDVVNGSLGTAYSLSSPLNATLAANLTKVGTLIVAAAGNSGQNFFATSSPGSHPEVLSVAGSADNEFLALSITAPTPAQYPAAEGGFTARLVDVGAIAGELVASSPALGCSAFTNAAAIAGKIALIDRGTCAFVTKFENAVAAGAIAAIIVDNEDDPLPFAMGGGDPGQISIPGALVTQDDGATIKAALGQGTVTIGLDPAVKYVGAGAELLLGFSARGPSPSDGRLKPEIAAPGFAIDSARVGSGTEPRRTQGTSMSSPMVAGAAALVRQAQPTWSPFEVKAALVNGGQALKNLSELRYGTSVVGGGRLDVARSVTQPVTAAADPTTGEVGVTFGATVADEPASVKRTFVVTNHGTSAANLDATVEPTWELDGVEVTVSPANVAIAAGESATLELTLSLDPAKLGAPGPDPATSPTQGGQTPTPRHWLNEASGIVRLSHVSGAFADLGLPYNGSVRGATNRKGTPPACMAAGGAPQNPMEVALEGGGAHPEPVVTAFQLGTLDDEDEDSATDPAKAVVDLRAVGAATDLAIAPSFAEARAFFGVAVTGTWTTPARGPISVVSVEIDSEGSSAADYAIRVEARNPDGPFRDALVASTYDISTGERFDRLPINLVAADVAKTYPFHNSVLAFSVALADIGVTPERPIFRYAAVSENAETLAKGERTPWVDFDASKLALDTARHGKDGVPLFAGIAPVLVEVSAEARTALQPLDLLLLHHTNVAGARFEVVSLLPQAVGNLALAASAPPEVALSQTQTVTLAVTNAGATPVANVKLAGVVTGGELVSTLPGQGSCAPGAALDCTLGEIAAAGTVTVTATVRAASASSTVVIDANVESDLPCESLTDDNTTQTTLAVTRETTTLEEPAVHAAGGCGCRVPGEPESDARGSWAAAALALLLALRGRRRPDA